MAVKLVHVSDLSGRMGEAEEFGQLIVRQHPAFAEGPIRLELLPDELGELPESTQYVQVEYIPPGERSGQHLTLTLEQFNTLAPSQDMQAILLRAIAEAHQARATQAPAPRRRGRPRRAEAAGADGQPQKVNYATLEHAGEPHRGRITAAEKELVRDNLSAINQRLRERGKREIDPSDPEMQERYGLSPSVA
ncbi:MAG TPA: hypothetical protein VG276_05400 [Actinomycetes bacterium]|jgi:hypothetical protein|nr:hypothetical protein [Actinomycetes bacterium]